MTFNDEDAAPQQCKSEDSAEAGNKLIHTNGLELYNIHSVNF